ncbi:MAG: DUF1501 domain-containing protein [Acidobacteriota bacterium]|nr:DUF1501 domain-containing protein [Acidobacteriota bacterium]
MTRNPSSLTRRQMLACCSTGFGAVALSGLLRPALAAPSAPDFPAKAKHVIFLYMSGGVSHVDSFDPKPRLNRDHGQPMPVKVERTQFNQNGNIFGSPWEFKNYGESGLPVSDLFPHVGACADDLCVVRSMTSTVNEHAQGNYFMHTGFPLAGHPSAGAWVNYGLGSENDNLPGFVVLQSGKARVPLGGVAMYGNGYLPAQYQGSILKGDRTAAVRNIQPLESESSQRTRLDFVRGIDESFLATLGRNADVEAAIDNYETAFRMQAEVPELCDISGESEATRRLYALDHENSPTALYGRQCLLARRLVERGVRFIELSCLGPTGGGTGNPWDQHSDLLGGHSKMALQVDQPIAGLLKDLKSRGLLDETLVIWAGEFGRTPFHQGTDGRDHNPFGFTIWMAGGGTKPGTIYGETDDLGYHVVQNEMSIYDLWATVLHQLGIDHYALTYRHAGRDFRLTDVHGRVVKDLLA